MARTRTQQGLRWFAVFAAYVLAAKGGLSVHSVSGFATLVWAPTGLALAAVVIWGRWMWPAIAAAAFTVNLWAGAPALVAVGIAGGNTIEALFALYALDYADFDPRLVRVREVIKLIVLGAFFSTVVSATFGVSSLWAGGVIRAPDVGAAWRAWWLGDALGALVVASLLLVWRSHPAPKVTWPRLIELAVLAIAIALALDLNFSLGQTHPLGKPYILYPGMIWAALRFGQRGAVTFLFLISAASVAATASGVGPFTEQTLSDSLISMQSFTAVMSVATLILGAAVTERNTAIKVSNASASASRFLADAGRVLAGSLDTEATLQRVARLVVPRLADNCVIDIVDAGGIRRVAEAASNPAKEPLLRQLRAFPVTEARPSPVLTVLQTGKTVFIPRFDLEAVRKGAAVDPYLQVILQIGPISSVTIPMMAGTKIVGTMTFGMAESGRTHSPEDISLAEELGVRAGLATENARLYEEARKAVQLRDEFLAVAAHELRTPLTALQLQVAMIDRLAAKTGLLDAAVLGPRISAVSRQLSRFTSLIDNLLDMSRVNSGRFTFEVEDVELVQLTREICGRFEEQALRGGSLITISTDANAIGGHWDRLRLDQVITNLLSNAVKYGAGHPIEVKLGVDEKTARLTVTDHGIGISSEDQARIFERFERAVSPRNFGGLGLGLWLVKELVTGMGASIRVESRPGEGAAFMLSLPRAR